MAIRGNFSLDENIIAAIPRGYKVVAADSYGSSAWNITARIITETEDGAEKRFLVKVHEGEKGRVKMEGEFLADQEIYNLMPSFGSKPYVWGKCKRPDPPTYFILHDFYDMSKHLPEPTQFCAKLADLHAKSVSPTGKFGFQVPAVQGIVAQKVDWNSSWASLFGTMLADLVQQDIAKNGPWPELEQAFEETRAIVIPRLLGVLETGGRTLKPCLIHGNMWEGNCGTELETGAVRIYDAGSFYAHNEMELGLWRSERIRLRSKAYMRQYLRNFGVSEPVDEFEDRIRCYSIKYNLAHSCHHAGSYVREKAFEDMCFLVAKYAPEMIHDDTEKE